MPETAKAGRTRNANCRPLPYSALLFHEWKVDQGAFYTYGFLESQRGSEEIELLRDLGYGIIGTFKWVGLE